MTTHGTMNSTVSSVTSGEEKTNTHFGGVLGLSTDHWIIIFGAVCVFVLLIIMACMAVVTFKKIRYWKRRNTAICTSGERMVRNKEIVHADIEMNMDAPSLCPVIEETVYELVENDVISVHIPNDTMSCLPPKKFKPVKLDTILNGEKSLCDTYDDRFSDANESTGSNQLLYYISPIDTEEKKSLHHYDYPISSMFHRSGSICPDKDASVDGSINDEKNYIHPISYIGEDKQQTVCEIERSFDDNKTFTRSLCGSLQYSSKELNEYFEISSTQVSEQNQNNTPSTNIYEDVKQIGYLKYIPTACLSGLNDTEHVYSLCKTNSEYDDFNICDTNVNYFNQNHQDYYTYPLRDNLRFNRKRNSFLLKTSQEFFLHYLKYQSGAKSINSDYHSMQYAANDTQTVNTDLHYDYITRDSGEKESNEFDKRDSTNAHAHIDMLDTCVDYLHTISSNEEKKNPSVV